MTKQFSSSEVKLDFKMVAMGNDLCVILTGGDVPHLGATAVTHVRPSKEAPTNINATTSVISLPGHKEDEIAKYIASSMAVGLNKNIVVCCGIHVNEFTAEKLEFIKLKVEEFVISMLESSKY